VSQCNWSIQFAVAVHVLVLKSKDFDELLMGGVSSFIMVEEHAKPVKKLAV
jgi:hypothetical protein